MGFHLLAAGRALCMFFSYSSWQPTVIGSTSTLLLLVCKEAKDQHQLYDLRIQLLPVESHS
jgi:hypothetical protein